MKKRKSSARDDLFQLIKSMSKSEKRYFKLFSGKNADTVYLKVFDLIEQQEIYDEGELKKMLKNLPVVNNFHVAKKYLFELIMKSLIIYHDDFKVDFKLKKMLQQVEICNQKGLHDISYRLLRQAEKIARTYDRPLNLLEIFSLQKTNLMDLIHQRYEQEKIEKIIESEQQQLKQLEMIHFYKSTITALFSEYVKWKGIRNPEVNKVFQTIKTHPLFQDESKADSIEAKLLMFSIKGYFFHELTEYDKSLYYRKKIIDLHESQKAARAVFPKNYLVSMHNFISDLSMLKRYEDVRESIDKYIEIEAFDESSKAEQFRRYYLMRAQYILDTGNFDEVKDLVTDFNQRLPKYEKIVSKNIIRLIQYYIGRCYFGAGEFDKSVQYFMKITNAPKNEQDTGVYAFTSLWHIFAHIELKNYEIIPYLTRSAERFYKNHQILFPVEKQIFKHFSNEKNLYAANLDVTLKKLRTVIEKNIHPIDEKFRIYREITDWLESKYQKKQLKEIIRNKMHVKK